MSTTFIPLHAIPWNSIAEGMVVREPENHSFEQALASPCASCTTSPCCTHLPLHSFTVATLMDLDHARYLLNFDHIELGLSIAGEWTVYYRYPCRFLDRDDFSCTVHGSAEQPAICVNYNPYSCWYRRTLTQPATEDFLRIDRFRLEALLTLLEFDGDGAIIGVPEWPQLVEAVLAVPLEAQPPLPEAPEPDPATRAWRADVVAGVPVQRVADRSLAELGDPCGGCAAYCCTTLLFPYQVPATRSALDHLRFCLGFPGVEVGLAEEGWSLIVRTRCRHLEGGRCSAYGSPERPLVCRYYDANTCSYAPQFGRPRPSGFVRLRLEEYERLTDCFRFDDAGVTVAVLDLDSIREHVEAGWRAAAAT